MSDKWAEVIQQLADSAFHYGPFFFSIWFLHAIARWSYKNYANLFASGRAVPEDLRNHWRYFVASTGFGCVLVAVSTVWWISNRPAAYIFQGEILGVDKDDQISSQDFYFRSSFDQDTEEKEMLFVAVEPQPFQSNHVFIINIRRRNGTNFSKIATKPLRIKYDSHPSHRYYLVADELVPIDSDVTLNDRSTAALPARRD